MFGLLCLLSIGLAAVNAPAATYYLTDGDAVAAGGVGGGVIAVGAGTAGGVAVAGASVGAVIATGGAALVVAGVAAA